MKAQSKLTQKSNIIIFSGNGQNKNKTNFKYANETIETRENRNC